MSNSLKIPFKAPLNPLDTPEQTYGCRANNPDICANCYLDGVCAFVTEDSICKKPSKAWKKQYERLAEEVKNETP